MADDTGRQVAPPGAGPGEEAEVLTLWGRLRRLIVGSPRDLGDPRLHHRMALIPLLAWVGLGADGLSSSCYGPEEAFHALGGRTYLALVLAVATALTVAMIAWSYGRIITDFPSGGGGYTVATKLLGPKAGLVSGCALLVDYVLTITVSIAAAGKAIFSFLPPEWSPWMFPAQCSLLFVLVALNLRGVRESVTVLAPVFMLFLATHAVLVLGGVGAHAGDIPQVLDGFQRELSADFSTIGIGGVLAAVLYAYSLGGGTYTGIEAVSNGVPIMREPRVRTAHRTMLYMALSLAITAGGLLMCFLLWGVKEDPHRTMNAVLTGKIATEFGLGRWFIVVTLATEAAILFVAAQAGFMDGPRTLANMALDSWVPHRFSALSERLTTQNGILLMGAASAVALLYTGGDVRTLVVMYSINVFLTFSLSMASMTKDAIRRRERHGRAGRLALFGTTLVACVTILVVTIFEKFGDGGWATLLTTGAVVAFCLAVHRHYAEVAAKLRKTYAVLESPPADPTVAPPGPLDPAAPTAAVLVATFGGLGVHTVLSLLKTFPGQFKNIVFVSVGVVDSGSFKGEGSVEALGRQTEAALGKYESLARGLGIPSTGRWALGTDAVAEAEALCLEVSRQFPKATFFAGKAIFEKETWVERLLHNRTAEALQRRLQWSGKTLVILPARAI